MLKVSKYWKWVWKYTKDRERENIMDSMVFLSMDFIYKWGEYEWYLIGVRKCDIYYSWYFTLFGIMFYIYMFWFYYLSSKFSRKLNFVESLAELAEIVPLEQASIPDRVKQWVFYFISWYFSIKSNVICIQGNLFQTGKLLHFFGPVLAHWDQYQSDTFWLLLT